LIIINHKILHQISVLLLCNSIIPIARRITFLESSDHFLIVSLPLSYQPIQKLTPLGINKQYTFCNRDDAMIMTLTNSI
jgi:hypothetical protein